MALDSVPRTHTGWAKRRTTTSLDLANRLALSIEEAAQALGVSESHMRTLRVELPCIHLGGRVVFPVDALREWLRAKAEAEPSEIDGLVEEIVGDLE